MPTFPLPKPLEHTRGGATSAQQHAPEANSICSRPVGVRSLSGARLVLLGGCRRLRQLRRPRPAPAAVATGDPVAPVGSQIYPLVGLPRICSGWEQGTHAALCPSCARTHAARRYTAARMTDSDMAPKVTGHSEPARGGLGAWTCECANLAPLKQHACGVSCLVPSARVSDSLPSLRKRRAEQHAARRSPGPRY